VHIDVDAIVYPMSTIPVRVCSYSHIRVWLLLSCLIHDPGF